MTSSSHCALVPFLLDAVEFLIEQVNEAKTSPAGQFAAVDAAQGILPYVWEKLQSDDVLIMMWLLSAGDPRGRPWNHLTRMPPAEFAAAADELIGKLVRLRECIQSYSPQSPGLHPSGETR